MLSLFITACHLLKMMTAASLLKKLGTDDFIDVFTNLAEDGAGLFGGNLCDLELALPVLDGVAQIDCCVLLVDEL